ncbi:MAG: hypothetical protein ACRERS_01075 [Methylococcales bacterium]
MTRAPMPNRPSIEKGKWNIEHPRLSHKKSPFPIRVQALRVVEARTTPDATRPEPPIYGRIFPLHYSSPETPMKHRIDSKIDCVFKALSGSEANRGLKIHFLGACPRSR